MSLRTEIESNYVDANGLVCSRPCLPVEVNPTGNGVCYSGEYQMNLKLRGEQFPIDAASFKTNILKCMPVLGLLSRGPGQPDIESVDDYYGFAAGCAATGNTALAQTVIDYGWKHWGTFDNVNVGKWSFKCLLWRQPQLMVALYASAGQAPWWMLAHRIWAALVILFSCKNAAPNDADSRRLAWLLIQTAAPKSWLCKLASKVWFNRLKSQYGNNGMSKAVAGYFSPDHPLTKYYVDQ